MEVAARRVDEERIDRVVESVSDLRDERRLRERLRVRLRASVANKRTVYTRGAFEHDVVIKRADYRGAIRRNDRIVKIDNRVTRRINPVAAYGRVLRDRRVVNIQDAVRRGVDTAARRRRLAVVDQAVVERKITVRKVNTAAVAVDPVLNHEIANYDFPVRCDGKRAPGVIRVEYRTIRVNRHRSADPQSAQRIVDANVVRALEVDRNIGIPEIVHLLRHRNRFAERGQTVGRVDNVPVRRYGKRDRRAVDARNRGVARVLVLERAHIDRGVMDARLTQDVERVVRAVDRTLVDIRVIARVRGDRKILQQRSSVDEPTYAPLPDVCEASVSERPTNELKTLEPARVT